MGKIIGAQLNSEILSEIIESLHKFFLPYNVPFIRLLSDLGTNSEIPMLAMFLQNEEKKSKFHAENFASVLDQNKTLSF